MQVFQVTLNSTTLETVYFFHWEQLWSYLAEVVALSPEPVRAISITFKGH